MKKYLGYGFIFILLVNGISACQSGNVEEVKRNSVKADAMKKEAKKKSDAEKNTGEYREKLKKLSKKARLGQKETLEEQEETFKEFMAFLHKNKEIDDKSLKLIHEKMNRSGNEEKNHKQD